MGGPVKASVLMGVYNPADTQLLRRSIQSVLAQSFGDFELLLCDDGSCPQVERLLVEIAGEDTRIRLLRNPTNQGLAHALNRCIREARGEYLFRQDDDDFSAPDRFQKQLAFLETHPEIDLVGCNLTLFDARGEWGTLTYPQCPVARDFLFLVPFMHGAVAYRAAAVHRLGGYSQEAFARRVEDSELFMRMYAAGCKGWNLQEPLYFYKEDAQAHRKRRYRYRLNELRVRYRGFASLGLLPGGWPYVVKPLVVGLLPMFLLNALKDRYYHRRQKGGSQ